MAFLQNYTEFWNFPSKFSVCTIGTCCTYVVSSLKGAADKCWICTNVSKSKQSKCYSISLVLWCLEINIGSDYLWRSGAFLRMSAAQALSHNGGACNSVWWLRSAGLEIVFYKKGEIRQSAAWDTCSSFLLQPRHPNGSWEGAEPSAGCGTAFSESWPADKCYATQALSFLLGFVSFPPPAFINLQPLCCTSYCLLSLEDVFSPPRLILCVKTPLHPCSLMACFVLTQRTNSNI